MLKICLGKLKENKLDKVPNLENINIHKEFSIHWSFCRGSSTHTQNMKIPEIIGEKLSRPKAENKKF